MMPNLTLSDVQDVSAFLKYIQIFLSEELHEDVETCLMLVHENKPEQKMDWIGRLKRLASHAWPVRMAVRAYVSTPEGIAEEHGRLLTYARPTTAFLLRRLRRMYPVLSLDDIAQTIHGQYALTEREREELGSLRPEIHGMMFRDLRPTLDPIIATKKEDMDRLLRVFRQARLLAERMEDRDARLAKVEEWEDRVLFGVEHPDESELLPLISFQNTNA